MFRGEDVGKDGEIGKGKDRMAKRLEAEDDNGR
jgi:hypothetical protein